MIYMYIYLFLLHTTKWRQYKKLISKVDDKKKTLLAKGDKANVSL